MDNTSELQYLKHVLGPEEIDRTRSAPRRGHAPIWLFPLLVVVALYGITFAIGFAVSNHAQSTFVARGDARYLSFPEEQVP